MSQNINVSPVLKSSRNGMLSSFKSCHEPRMFIDFRELFFTRAAHVSDAIAKSLLSHEMELAIDNHQLDPSSTGSRLSRDRFFLYDRIETQNDNQHGHLTDDTIKAMTSLLSRANTSLLYRQPHQDEYLDLEIGIVLGASPSESVRDWETKLILYNLKHIGEYLETPFNGWNNDMLRVHPKPIFGTFPEEFMDEAIDGFQEALKDMHLTRPWLSYDTDQAVVDQETYNTYWAECH